MNIDIIKKAIENDDLNLFELNFNIEDCKKTIGEIDNYIGLKSKSGEIYKFQVNYLQYSIYCKAEKIFKFLIEKNINVNKDEYKSGFPPLLMAIQEKHFAFAKEIINHKSFSKLDNNHITLFNKYSPKTVDKEMIEVGFLYLSKFSMKEVKEKLYSAHNLVFHNEDSLDRFEKCYRKEIKEKGKFFIENFFNKEKIKRQIFETGFKDFILKKISENKKKEIIEETLITDTERFFQANSFKDENAKKKIQYLFENSINAKNHFEGNAYIYLEISLEAFKELDLQKVDFFKNNLVLEVILRSNKNIKVKTYLLENYTRKVLDRLEEKKVFDNDYKYCQNKVLKEEIEQKDNIKKEIKKVKI